MPRALSTKCHHENDRPLRSRGIPRTDRARSKPKAVEEVRERYSVHLSSMDATADGKFARRYHTAPEDKHLGILLRGWIPSRIRMVWDAGGRAVSVALLSRVLSSFSPQRRPSPPPFEPAISVKCRASPEDGATKRAMPISTLCVPYGPGAARVLLRVLLITLEKLE
ncbi:hypothetical protein GGTG_10416 [Gaeumannomyces tritici R3-111a-1]|uniref:Uncharacterized protein n=1 Tax=Gaeumannomyces tritici (strain R3-111a-1) TaxID=644352 RepID=J3PA90_GAET3|nr:hypothetical protein GGTG_10416 [Gaeumannomyces tritici R3-111a-1]EJT71156.1 hypothetical protein GGTG_10416 [Gaeumannomyces tritici R3-111a-1]